MLYIDIETGENEAIDLTDDSKDKLFFYSEKENVSKGKYISNILNNHFAKKRHPKQEEIHITTLPQYDVHFDNVYIAQNGYRVIGIEESEEIEDKYILEYIELGSGESLYEDCDNIVIGINKNEHILCLDLHSRTTVLISEEEKEFIGIK